VLRKSGSKIEVAAWLDAPCSEVQMVSFAVSSRDTEKVHEECLWTVLVCIGSCSTEVHGPSGRVAADVALVRGLGKV
jgi:hypothetical protein